MITGIQLINHLLVRENRFCHRCFTLRRHATGTNFWLLESASPETDLKKGNEQVAF
jgi:hypothetical protein